MKEAVTIKLKAGEVRNIISLKLIFIIIVIVGLLLYYFLIFVPSNDEAENQTKYRDPGQEALGFRTGTPYVDGKEVFMITEIIPNGSMDKAGVREGDIILDKTIGQFFKDIYQHREKKYSFRIEREATIITITVNVPHYEL